MRNENEICINRKKGLSGVGVWLYKEREQDKMN